MKKINTLFWPLFLGFFLVFCDASKADESEKESKKEKKEGKKGKKEKGEAPSENIKITQKWELPAELQEVSGIAYLGNNSFACIQDELGIIFIYNTKSGKIERQTPFGGTGDYEGIAVVGNNAFVLRSDGHIYEVTGIDLTEPKVTEHDTPLTAQHDVEGITYDQKNNRLLLAIKGDETGNGGYKGVYAFNLATKKMSVKPVIKLSLNDPLLGPAKGKKPENGLQPSEIAIHPTTGDLYVTEAANSRLLVIGQDGKLKSRYILSGKEFSQPEGMTFSPTGDLFISNEGKKESGNILQVTIE